MTERKVRLAAIQDAPLSLNLSDSIAKFGRLVQKAASDPYKADILVFPEAFISCYPRGYDFGTVIGSRSDEGREWFRRYYESSLDIEGNSLEWRGIQSIVRQQNVTVVLGVIEKDPARHNTLFCTAATIGSDGRLLAKHRKLLPTASERLVWGQGDGSGIQVASTPHGKIGAVICWENYVPLLRSAMYSLGVEIYCAPTADGRDLWVSTMRHIAAEGRCFVVSVNQFCVKTDYPTDYPAFQDKSDDYIVTRGGSMIVDPMGNVLAGPLYNESGILCAEVDLNDIPRAKFDFDPVGHYSRPDIFHLHVDNTSRSGTSFGVNPSSS